MSKNIRRVLVVAGSDSSGGAGLEADQKVIAAHGCYAMTATAALTAQNTQGVYGIHEIPPNFVQKQIDACIDDIGVDVLKTGMLASAQTVGIVANAIRHHNVPISVVDPVMVSTSGAQLLPENAVINMVEELLPLTTVLTPNIPEATLILRKAGKEPFPIDNLNDLKRLAAEIHSLGPKYILLKGGHFPLTADYQTANTENDKKLVCNIFFGGDTIDVIEFPYQKTKHTHGTGCSLASALACNLALGLEITQAVVAACRYVDAGIKTATKIGSAAGSGPINHFHSIRILPFPPGNFIDYMLERFDVQPAWHDFTHHDFVEKLGDGTLEIERYKFYMVQDYLYLIQFARANALAGYKAKTLDDVAASAAIVGHVKTETALHVKECEALGLTEEAMMEAEEHQACTAYTRFVLDVGMSEDWLALQVALLPCLLGYAVIAKRLKGLQLGRGVGNRYASWIENYVAEDYMRAVRSGCALVEKHAHKQSPTRIEELVKIFIHATKMETGFWDMAEGSSASEKKRNESVATASTNPSRHYTGKMPLR
ncbi:putative thiaminase-2/PQQC, pyridoxamine kinase/Phosphomethylpyrimidine kinase, thiaminase II [Septoria linicola]|nr:putative thiaminase-2/PQQC, pyridoxamine kinase/Phosphomethylpyrimidine kinase, thiaminase II [Septoria linicola]